jgi:hypothetical protein
MNAKKVLHITAVFCLVILILVPLDRASAGDNTHYILMSGLPTDRFQGYGWPAGTQVAATVVDPAANNQVIFSSTQESKQGSECYFRPNICATFDLNLNLEPGWVIEVTAGGVSIEFMIADVKVTSVDLGTDLITGTINPPITSGGDLAVLFFYPPPDCDPGSDYLSFDATGNWTADFTACNIVLGSWGALNYFAENGVMIGSWHAPAYTLKGFYQPVDMDGVYNIVKNGSTVPLKFEIFNGSTELTDTAEIASFTFTQIACDTNAITDYIETTATDGTRVRYDTTAGQFVYNWKTPKTAGSCYEVDLITVEGSMLWANFVLR